MKPDTLLGSFNFVTKDPAWFEKREQVASVIDAILGTSLGKLVKVAGERRSPKKASSVEAVHKAVATGKSGMFALNADARAFTFASTLSITRGALGVDASLFDDVLAERRKSAIDDLVEIAAAVRKCKPIAGLRWGYVAPLVRDEGVFEYPRPRPPRTFDTINAGAIADTIDLRFHRSKHEDAAEGARRLADAKLPDRARRAEKDGLLVIRWAEDVGDAKALQRGCAAHEEWLARFLPSEIDGDYNELGDAAEPMGDLEEHPLLTMYDPSTEVGYVAVLVQDGEPSGEAWTLALKTAKSRKLPDGTRVAKVRVIMQLRELALQMGKKARRQGIDAVLYPDDDGAWWDPDPPGNWAGPPRASGESTD